MLFGESEILGFHVAFLPFVFDFRPVFSIGNDFQLISGIDGPDLVFVGPCGQMEQAVLESKEGYFLRFPLAEVPVQKKAAQGVRGMTLGEDDRIHAVYLLEASKEFAIEYHGGRMLLSRLKLAKRGGRGNRSRR